MAVTQISRIQHRRGLEQDLPQLSSAELGWSIDTRQLYIGNGTLEEGAPIIGVTRILTTHDIDEISGNLSIGINKTNYTLVANSAGYTVQTGASSLTPVIRSYQQKFDDFINVRDFGAVGDNSTDDTSAINRAIQEVYKSTVSPTEPRARRTIFFPGGSYVVSSPVLIPPYAKLVGDGMNSAIIRQTQGNQSVANVCDSLFQTGTSLGSGSAVLPQDIEIVGIQFQNSNTMPNIGLFQIDSASNVRVQSCEFRGNAAAGFYANLISVRTSTATTQKITFDSCQFIRGGNGIGFAGTGVTSFRVLNSGFDDLSNVAVHLNDSLNFSSIGNYFGTVGGFFVSNGNNYNVSLGDHYKNSNPLRTGITLGNIQIASSQQYTISSTPLALVPVSNTAAAITYEIRNGANARFGTFNYTKTNTTILYDDSYNETNVSVGANISANNDSILVSLSSDTATFKFNYQTFI
jgi:hypothetical protein